jgi:hypothetical protein
VLGAWAVACAFRCRPWAGSIKPGLWRFQFCRVGLSLGVLYLSIFLSISNIDKLQIVMCHMDILIKYCWKK